jgi:hypothetical protein
MAHRRANRQQRQDALAALDAEQDALKKQK